MSSKFFSSKFIGRKFNVTAEHAVKFLGDNGRYPVMILDEVPYYDQESLDFIQAGVDSEGAYLQRMRDFGYRVLNEILYPDGSGNCSRFEPLERFLSVFGEAPGRDYTGELRENMDARQRSWVANKAWHAERYWEDVEDRRVTIERERKEKLSK